MPPHQHDAQQAVEHVAGDGLGQEAADQRQHADKQHAVAALLRRHPQAGHRGECQKGEQRIHIGEPATIDQRVARQIENRRESREQLVLEDFSDEPGEREPGQHGRGNCDEARGDQDVVRSDQMRDRQGQPGEQAGPPVVLAIESGDDGIAACPHFLGDDDRDGLLADILQEQGRQEGQRRQPIELAQQLPGWHLARRNAKSAPRKQGRLPVDHGPGYAVRSRVDNP